jgi:hypothetical protein
MLCLTGLGEVKRRLRDAVEGFELRSFKRNPPLQFQQQIGSA